MGKKKKEEHEQEYDLDDLHDPGKAGKGCLTRHEKRVNNKCSHIWEAMIRAEGTDWKIYGWRAYESMCQYDYFKTRNRGDWPRGYGEERNCPKPNEWDPGVGENFKRFDRPYWHNSHHIIPNGSLKSAIAEAAKKNARLDNLIRAGLLVAEYNLNEQHNMINLPMEGIVASHLNLPRHLVGDEVGPDEKEEFFSHKDYNVRVETKLTSIMNDYVAALEDALKNHPPSPKQLSRRRLTTLEKNTRKEIIDAGKDKPGLALSEIVF